MTLAVPSEPPEKMTIAGFWQRILALLIDAFILGAAGIVLGLVLGNQFAKLGGIARVIGFTIALLYFGFMNSALSAGQSFGKRLAKIRVVGSEGQPISIARSFARFSVLGVAFFLNGAPIQVQQLQPIRAALLSVAVFGLGLSVVYLYVFNRSTRQSLHDLLVGSYVCKSNSGTLSVGTVSKGHYLVVVGLILTAALAPMLVGHLADKEPFTSMLRVQQALQEVPGVAYSSVTDGQTSMNTVGGSQSTSTFISAHVVLRERTTNYDPIANTIAGIVLRTAPQAAARNAVHISLSYGYDIGIASSWSTKNFSYSPQEWKERMEQSNQAL